MNATTTKLIKKCFILLPAFISGILKRMIDKKEKIVKGCTSQYDHDINELKYDSQLVNLL